MQTQANALIGGLVSALLAACPSQFAGSAPRSVFHLCQAAAVWRCVFVWSGTDKWLVPNSVREGGERGLWGRGNQCVCVVQCKRLWPLAATPVLITPAPEQPQAPFATTAAPTLLLTHSLSPPFRFFSLFLTRWPFSLHVCFFARLLSTSSH